MDKHLSHESSLTLWATVIAIGFVLLIWILDKAIIGKKKSILEYFEGQDGRSSTSKFQFFVFTFAFVFAFVLIHVYFWLLTGFFRLIDTIPVNVMIAMGFSCITFVGAKAITVTGIASGKLTKPAPLKGNDWSFLVTDDAGNLQFAKFQMLIWTLIAVIIFFIDSYKIIAYVNIHGGVDFFKTYNPDSKDPFPLLPDINPALMVLMGLGQGTYLGGKLILAAAPRLTGISIVTKPTAPAVNPVLMIQGGDFGTRDGNQILMDGMPLGPAAVITAWNQISITFDPGPKHPNGQPFTAGQLVQVSVIVNGINSSNTLPFTF